MSLQELKITDNTIAARGVVSAPDRLAGTAQENKAIFDKLIAYTVRSALNPLIDALSGAGGAAEIGAADGRTVQAALDEAVRSLGIKGIRLNADNQIEVSVDGETWSQTASGGHIILDQEGRELAQRARLQILNAEISDDGQKTIVHGIVGPKGDKGDTGSQGPQGVQGIQGPDGKVFVPAISNEGIITWTLTEGADTPSPRNIRGPQGIQGVQGMQGERGPAGTPGPAGPQGPKGDKGGKGDTGPQGVAGVTGAQGPKGDPGETGPQGPQGPRGIQGETGPAGPAGVQGPMGPQGPKGNDGADGRSFTVKALYPTLIALQTAHPTGAPGDAYAVGTAENNTVYLWDADAAAWADVGSLQGPQGPQGVQGVQGPKGETGTQGPEGVQGPIGPKGDPGPQGPSGAAATVTVGTVTTGSPGGAAAVTNGGTTSAAILNFTIPQGPKGDKGDPGEQGPAGPKGDAGPTGPQGVQGPQGEQGIPGPQGEQGPKGNPATVNGKTGESIVLAAADVGAAPASHATDTAIHTTAAEKAVWNGKADKSTHITATLLAANWTGDVAPFTYTLAVEGVTPNGPDESIQEILPAVEITPEQLAAAQTANLQDGGQTAGSVTLKAFGEKPALDIPIRVILRGDA